MTDVLHTCSIKMSYLSEKSVCIENACLIRGSKEGVNGALHLMKTLIQPAESNMFQVLTKHGGFK